MKPFTLIIIIFSVALFSCNNYHFKKKSDFIVQDTCKGSLHLVAPQVWNDWKNDSLGSDCKRYLISATYDLSCLFKGQTLDTLIYYLGKPNFINRSEGYGRYEINSNFKSCSPNFQRWYLDFEFDSKGKLIIVLYANPCSG